MSSNASADILCMANVLYLIQARQNSKRLPGKVLLDLGGIPLLSNVVNDLPKQDLVVVTGPRSRNQAIASYCASNSIKIFFGDENNVFSRFLENAIDHPQYPYIARLTGDNPCLHKASTRQMLEKMEAQSLDYCIQDNVPLGSAFEIFKRESLLKIAHGELSESSKEHVTAEFYAPESPYRWAKLDCELTRIKHLRFTVDTQQDLDFMRDLSLRFGQAPCNWKWDMLLEEYDKNPELFLGNQSVAQRSVSHVESEDEF